MSIDRLWYEFKLRWKSTILVPICAVVIISAFAAMQQLAHAQPSRTLLALVEMFLPLTAGILTSAAVSQDPMIELQLTMPRKYAVTGLLRQIIILIWIGLVACIALTMIDASKQLLLPDFLQTWPPLTQFLLKQLIWFAPLCWFAGLGFFLSLATNSRASAGALLGCIWLLEILVWETFFKNDWLHPWLVFATTMVIYPGTGISENLFHTAWTLTRYEVLAGALLFFLLGWALFRNRERLLKGATTE